MKNSVFGRGWGLFVILGGLVALLSLHRVAAVTSSVWNWVDIGLKTGEAAGRVEYGADGSYVKVSSVGAGFSVDGDDLAWVGEKMEGTDATLVVLMSDQVGQGWQGITLRKTLDGVSDGVFLGFNPDGKLGMLSRPDGDWLEQSGAVGDVLWLKLEKQGARVRGYYSKDGENWNQIGALDLKEASGIYAGAVVSGNNGAESSARYALYGMAPGLGGEGAAGGSVEPSGTAAGQAGGTGTSGNGGAGGPAAGGMGNGNRPGGLGAGSANVIYVDNLLGNDTWDGKVRSRGAGMSGGPKRSLRSAVESARGQSGKNLEIVMEGRETAYSWESLPQTGKEIVIRPVGEVRLSGGGS